MIVLRLAIPTHAFIAAAIVTLLFSGASAHAGLVGYQLTISPGQGDGFPQFELANLSDSQSITNLQFTIGDTSRNFDGYDNVVTPPGVTATFNGLDTDLFGGLDSDLLDVDLTGFTAGTVASFDFQLDIDFDTSNSGGPAFYNTFWNNGAADNSQITVTFANGQTLTQTIDDDPTPVPGAGRTYVFSQTSAVVPEPASLASFAAMGLVGLAGLRRRQRTARG